MRSCVGQIWEESDPRYITKSTEVRLRSFTTKVHKVDRVTALCRRGARRLPWTRSAVSAQPCWPRPIAAAVGFSEACTHPLQHPHRDVTQCHTRDMTRRGCYTRWGRVHTGPPHGPAHRREEGTGPLSLARWRWSRTEQKTSAHAHAGPSPMQKTPALRVGKLSRCLISGRMGSPMHDQATSFEDRAAFEAQRNSGR
jgi:hypothetical protein